MRSIYEQLDCGSFDEVEQSVRELTQRTRDYRPNKYTLPPEVADRVRGRWAPYFQRYGYSGDEAVTPST
jgi:hypothetical protein